MPQKRAAAQSRAESREGLPIGCACTRVRGTAAPVHLGRAPPIATGESATAQACMIANSDHRCMPARRIDQHTFRLPDATDQTGRRIGSAPSRHPQRGCKSDKSERPAAPIQRAAPSDGPGVGFSRPPRLRRAGFVRHAPSRGPHRASLPVSLPGVERWLLRGQFPSPGPGSVNVPSSLHVRLAALGRVARLLFRDAEISPQPPHEGAAASLALLAHVASFTTRRVPRAPQRPTWALRAGRPVYRCLFRRESRSR